MKFLISVLLVLVSYNLLAQTIPYKQLGSSGLIDRTLISTSTGYQEIELGDDFNISNSELNISSSFSLPYNGPWTVSGSNISKQTGTVTIGNPAALRLEIPATSISNIPNNGVGATIGILNSGVNGSVAGDIIIQPRTSVIGSTWIYAQGSPVAKFQYDGNVGIGITNPTAKLQVDGNIRIPNTGRIEISGGGTIGTLSSGYRGFYAGNANLLFQTFDGSSIVDRLLVSRISGNIGIGASNPIAKLHVNGNALISSLAGVGTRMVTTNSTGELLAAAIPNASDWSTFPAIQNVELGSNWINSDGGANKGFRWVSTDYMQVETQSTSPIITTFSNGNTGTISLSNETTGEWSLGTAAKISGLSNNFVKLSIGNTDFEFDDVGLVLPEYSSGTVEDGTLYRDATTGRLMWYDPDLLQDREVAMLSDTETTQTTYTTNTAIGVGTDIVYLDYSTNQTHTLTLASNLEDKKLTIMNIGTANATLDGFANQTIMGSATYVLAPNESITLNTPVGSTDIKVISKN